MRRAGSALIVGLLSVLLACAEPTAGRGPDATLAGAVDRTLAAESFAIRSVVTDGRDRRVSRIEYEAPDRVRIDLHPAGRTISIGGETYFSTPEEPDRFVLVETRCDAALDVAVPALGVVREATEVRREGPIFVFRSSSVEGMIGQARIQDGHLASLLLRYELPDADRTVIERYAFSRFGDEISIDPPAPAAVSPGAAPSTNQGGSSGACP